MTMKSLKKFPKRGNYNWQRMIDKCNHPQKIRRNLGNDKRRLEWLRWRWRHQYARNITQSENIGSYHKRDRHTSYDNNCDVLHWHYSGRCRCHRSHDRTTLSQQVRNTLQYKYATHVQIRINRGIRAYAFLRLGSWYNKLFIIDFGELNIQRQTTCIYYINL